MTVLDYAIEYIHSRSRFGKKEGLENMKALLALLGDPQKRLAFVHVAGTNGKGSVTRMLTAMLGAQGYRVGCYTSPYLERFYERIRIGDVEISPQDLHTYTMQVKQAVDKLEAVGVSPTEFEVLTAVAFLYYDAQDCDVVVLEVGLGGLYDCTNVIEAPLCSVITSIGYDHMHILGNSLEEIAMQKAGIIKPGCPVVVGGGVTGGAFAVIREQAEDIGAELRVADEEAEIVEETLSGTRFLYAGREYCVALPGRYQVQNALTALQTAQALQTTLELAPDAIMQGLSAVRWAGRFEVFYKQPLFVLDGAHNLQGAEAFADSAVRLLTDYEITLIVGMLPNKDYRGVLKSLSRTSKKMIVTAVPNERGGDPAQIFAAAKAIYEDCVLIPDNYAAIEHAVAEAKENSAICVVGSLYLVGHVRHFVEIR